MNYFYLIIVCEGWLFIVIVVVIVLLIYVVGGFGFVWLFWLLFVFVVQFFCDLQCLILVQLNVVLCLVDGCIVVVEIVQDLYVNCEVLKISVFMNVFNVYLQCLLVDGVISKVEYFLGVFLNVVIDKVLIENECNVVVIQMVSGKIVILVQIVGLIVCWIFCYVCVGELLLCGQCYGFICFGLCVDVYLLFGSCVKVLIGEKVYVLLMIFVEFEQ